jgi:hypothetical protein
MHRLCLSGGGNFLSVLALLVGLVAACGSSSSPPATPASLSQAQMLGLEIAQTYGKLMVEAKDIVEPRPTAADAKEELRQLREEYKVYFGNYGCLRDAMSLADQDLVASTAAQDRDKFGPGDMSWLQDAADDYDLEDPAISGLLSDIETLDDYAYVDQLATRRPGETIVCNT